MMHSSDAARSPSSVEALRAQREASLRATAEGPPARTVNPFFGVGPITNMTADELERRATRFEFEAWVEATYRKVDDKGRDRGPFTVGELERSMHRGYPADKIVLDMMREIHRYFGFPAANRMAVGLGGGHNGFSVALLHLMNPADTAQGVYVDTPKVETEAASAGGFFRQSWGAQVLELHEFARNGAPSRVHFADQEGHIPSPQDLQRMGIKLVIGVGHETTGATTYNEQDVRNLLAWLDLDRNSHHALLDGTSLLGAMPWPDDLVRQLLEKACFFMPFQKAVGGVAGYFAATFTPQALALVERNVQNPSWAIPRHLKLAVPKDARRPLTGEKTTALGPFYDAQTDKMLGGIINTFSNTAFAETTFGILSMQKRVGSVQALNRQSAINRDAVAEWVERHPLFELGVKDASRRGAAVTLLRVRDADITDPALSAAIIAKAKQLLSYEGLTHPNGDYEPGLDVARYINAFPGTPGDFRAWIGGIRPRSDIVALLDGIEYAYHRAKVVVLEEQLARAGVTFPATGKRARVRKDDPQRAYKVLIADPVGLRFGRDARPDASEVRAYIEKQGAVFHDGPLSATSALQPGRIHFFYQPDLSRAEEILAQTAEGQYDALIAAATFIPKGAAFELGGVRIGAGTGNMGSDSWGGGAGKGGAAPLMNTPSFNSRATAHAAFKALLRAVPDLPFAELHDRVLKSQFDTGRDLKQFAVEKLEGQRIAILGFGNIGREMAGIARSFGLQAVVYARPKYREGIESEGYAWAASPKEAAQGARFLSIHTGLGAQENGRYANQGLVDRSVLSALADGAIIINYDRGEVIDTAALREAFGAGKVHRACIDADVFVDAQNRATGPLAAYLDLAREFPRSLELLPHVAADTEHVSRVEGARQAVDQILRAIQYREVVNLKGDLPAGYYDAGSFTVRGVGKVDAAQLSATVSDDVQLKKLRALSEELAAFWSAVDSTPDPERRAELIQRHGRRLVLDSNRYATQIEALGLKGPYGDPTSRS